jgi:D-alanyl-D-alanine carboxypeptidase
VPSHRADTPADAPTALLTRPSAPPSAHPPPQRRRDLRARGNRPATTAPRSGSPAGGLDWLDTVRPRPAEEWAAPWSTGGPAPDAGAQAPTVGALALDQLFLGAPGAGSPDGPLAPVQPLRRPRGKERAQAQRTSRSVRTPSMPVDRPARRPALPQAGIAGALGIATIAVPLAGALGAFPGTGTQSVPSSAAAALTSLPASPPVVTSLGDRRLLPEQQPLEVPTTLAAPRARRTVDGRASRSATRLVLPGCQGKVPDVRGVGNGQLPASMLCTLWDPKRQLRSDAAVALAKLNVVYTKRFGHPICFNDAYRSLGQQYAIKARRGGYAARPGTSEHGWGLAVDLCDGVDAGPGSVTYSWLRAHAHAFGWENPTWARSGGAGPYEPWHWEYLPGEQDQSQGD